MLVEKEVVAPGTYWYVDESTGQPRKLVVTSDMTKRWHSEGQKMIGFGLPIPVPYEHDFQQHPMTPKEKLLANAGEVRGYFLKDIDDPHRGKVKDVLFSSVEIQDPEVKGKIGNSIRWTSPWINSFTDGDGRRWENVISHLALTTRPRITRQQPFPSIAAALSIATQGHLPVPGTSASGFCLSRAGCLHQDGLPAYPVAFSMIAEVRDAAFAAREYKRDTGGRFAASQAAHKATMEAVSLHDEDGDEIRQHSKAAVDTAKEGNSKNAARFHRHMAEHHRITAGDFPTSSGRHTKHKRAAELHKRAADLHEEHHKANKTSWFSTEDIHNVDAFFSMEELEQDTLDPDVYFNLDEDVFADLEDDKEYEVFLSVWDDGTIEGIALASWADYHYAATGKRPSVEDTAKAAHKAANSKNDSGGRSTYGGFRSHEHKVKPKPHVKGPEPVHGGSRRQYTRDKVGRFTRLHSFAKRVHEGAKKHAKSVYEGAKGIVTMLGKHVKDIGHAVREGTKKRWHEAKSGLHGGVTGQHTEVDTTIGKAARGIGRAARHAGQKASNLFGRARRAVGEVATSAKNTKQRVKEGPFRGYAVGMSVEDVFAQAISLGIDNHTAMEIALSVNIEEEESDTVEIDAFFSLDELEQDELNPEIYFGLDSDPFADLEDDKEYDVVLSIWEDGTVEGIALAGHAGIGAHATGASRIAGHSTGAKRVAEHEAHAGGDRISHKAVGRFSSLHKHATAIHGFVTKHAKMLGEKVKKFGSAVKKGISNRWKQAKSGFRHGVSGNPHAGKQRAYKAGKAAGKVAGAAGRTAGGLARSFSRKYTTPSSSQRKEAATLSIDQVFARAVELGIDHNTAMSIALAAMPPGADEDEDELDHEEDPGGDEEDDMEDQPGDVDPAQGGATGGNALRMEEILCHLLQALGVPMPDDSDQSQFQRHLYEAAMSKIKELTSKGMGEKEKDKDEFQPDQNKPPNQQPNASKPNPLIQQEQQPMYMSLEEISKLPEPMKGVALAMYAENQKLRTQVEASKKITDGLRDDKLKVAGAARQTRITLLSKMSPRVRADLEAMQSNPAMALSMGDGGVVIDPMASTLNILEKTLGDMPRLLTADNSALSVAPQPTDESTMSDERANELADGMARKMGCTPQAKAG